MSSALIRQELKAETTELDLKYNSDSKVFAKKARTSKNFHAKKFKQHPKVDEVARSFREPSSLAKKREEEKIRSNVNKLLELSSSVSSNTSSKASILDQVLSTKRHYEPKGRQLLKPRQKKSKKEEAQSVFTEEDFEHFKEEYFAHSAPITKKAKNGLD